MRNRHVTLTTAVVVFIAAFVTTPVSMRADTYPRQPGIKITNYSFDYTLSEALRATLRLRDLTDADLVAVVQRTERIRSDHHQSQTLRAILRHAGAGDGVRQAVRTAAAGLSRHYRDEVERATGR